MLQDARFWVADDIPGNDSAVSLKTWSVVCAFEIEYPSTRREEPMNQSFVEALYDSVF